MTDSRPSTKTDSNPSLLEKASGVLRETAFQIENVVRWGGHETKVHVDFVDSFDRLHKESKAAGRLTYDPRPLLSKMETLVGNGAFDNYHGTVIFTVGIGETAGPSTKPKEHSFDILQFSRRFPQEYLPDSRKCANKVNPDWEPWGTVSDGESIYCVRTEIEKIRDKLAHEDYALRYPDGKAKGLFSAAGPEKTENSNANVGEQCKQLSTVLKNMSSRVTDRYEGADISEVNRILTEVSYTNTGLRAQSLKAKEMLQLSLEETERNGGKWRRVVEQD